jgi:predicted nucleic acid-binding protein
MAVSPKEAVAALAINLEHPRHQFWPDDISLAAGLGNLAQQVVSHNQVTDAYLLALAAHHRGKLATMDRGIASWAGSAAVEVIA